MGQITGPLNPTGHPPTYRLPRYIGTGIVSGDANIRWTLVAGTGGATGDEYYDS
jgi:hypothetical protein